MAAPRNRLVAKLKGMAAVEAIVGTKAFPVKAPQGTVLPYITYQQTADPPANHSTGATSTAECRIQVNCWASTYDGAVSLAAAVRGNEAESAPTGISGWIDDEGNVWHLQNEADGMESIMRGRDEFEAFQVVHNYLVWHE